MNRKCFASAKAMIIFILIFALTFCVPALGESYDAGTMRLLRYEGDVEILNAEGQSRFVLENVRFASGEVMRTGKESLASVSLDDSKIVTLDAETRVEFIEESNHLRLNLVEGRIFLDVREKLDENESLDIQTSTMTVGIRGTMVCISHSEDEQISQTQIMLLEGKTDLDYLDSSGSHRLLPLSAGQKAVVLQSSGDGEGVTPAVSQLTAEDLPVLVRRIVSEDPTVRQRVLEGSEEAAVIFGPMQEAPAPENVNPYPDQGSWAWNETVTLVAQSASKLYDGEALTRSSNVLVYGLPGDFTIDVSARGSQTDAGESENTVSDCIIRNAMGEDVTSHFRSIRKISGQLVVNPIPVSVWTGSAEKYYDGLPLTNPEAGIRGLERTVTGQQDWENASVVSKTALGSEAMIAVSGSTWVHATNPITKESQDIELLAGQRLTVCVKNEQESDSIFYQIDTLKVEDLPDEILLLYANNPELLSKACDETGWDPLLLTERINALKASEESTVTKNGLTVQDSVQDRLMTNSASVNINIDSAITNYNSRALTEKEAHFTPIVLDSGITVTATGSQTEVGSSENGYTISWGGANENNYIVTGEELGTLTVLPRLIDSMVVISAASDSKTYDGTQLRNGEYTVYGLPAGYRLRATVSGSRTDAGITENRVTDYRIYGPSGEDVTDQFINVFTENGELAVNRAPLAVSTGSASKVYDGEALEYAEASLSGLVSGETAAITATGIVPGQVGTADNTYEIDWGTAKKGNYYIASEKTGSLTIEPLNIEINFGDAEASYNGSIFLPEPSVTYTNGAHAGETVTGFRLRSTDALFRFILFTEDTVDVSITGMGRDAGTYTLTGSVQTDPDSEVNWSSSFAGMTLTIDPCEMKVETPSASKAYDGTALTAGPATVTGLVKGETATVTVTGSQTEVGSSDNTYAIEWGTARKENYTIAESLGRLTVTDNASGVTLTAASASKTYDGTALTDSTVTVSGLPEGFTLTATAAGSQTNAGSSENIVKDGYVIKNTAGDDVTASFTNITLVPGTLTVEKASATVKTGSASKPYDGTALTKADASITGLVGGETAAVTATGSQTEKGSSANTYSIDWGTTNKDNYAVTENLGILEVTVNDTPVVLTAASASKTYDGTALTDDTVTAEGLPAGFTVSAVVSGSQTDAGSRANTIVSYTILDSFGSDVTLSFTDVVPVDGTLTVTPAALTVTTGSAAKKYDGTALTKAEVSVAGLVTDETVTVTATGSQTNVGTSENTYTIVWGTAKAGNYTLTENLGTLEVTANDTLVTFTAESKSKVYDGTVLTAEGVTADGLPSGFTFTASASGSQKDAGSGENTVSSWKIFNADSSDVSAYFTNVTAVSGTLTVTPAPAAVTTGSDSKMYDGTALTKAEASITGLVGSETAAVTATGVIITVGTAENTYSIEWGTAKAGNYTLTESLGILKVTPNDTLITITSGNGYMRYKPSDCVVKNSDYTVEGLSEGFTLTAEITGEQSWAVGSSANTIASYKITNAASEDVTSCFSNVQKTEGTLTVDRAIVTIWSDDSEKTYNGTPLYGGTIHWTGIYGTDNAQHGISITHNIGLTDAGSVEDKFSVHWNYPELESLYETEEHPGTLTVKPAQLTVTTGSASKAYDGTALTKAEASVSGLVTDETVTVTATGSQTDVGTGSNTYAITWGTAKESNYILTENLGTLTVTANDTSIVFTAASGTKSYDGTELTDTSVTVSGLPAGFTFTAAAEGSQTDAGSSANKVTSYQIFNEAEKDVTASFSNISTADGTLTVNRVRLNISFTGGGTYVYDGSNHSCNALADSPDMSNITSGMKMSFGDPMSSAWVVSTPYGELHLKGWKLDVTDAGTYELNCSYTFTKGNPDNFIVTVTPDTLVITPAPVKIKTESASKEYDGTALTAPGTITGLTAADQDKVTFNVTGKITSMGTAENTYEINWGSAKESNYIVTKELGTLTVTKNTTPVVFTSGSASKVYDGTPLSNSSVTVEGLPDGFTWQCSAGGTFSVWDAGTYTNSFDDIEYSVVTEEGTMVGWRIAAIRDADGKDVTDAFTLQFVEGTLRIDPAELKITTESTSKVYDGTELTAPVTVTGLVSADESKVTVTATGSQTNAGNSKNNYTIDWGTARSDNYTITEEIGTLTVQELELNFVISDNTYTYTTEIGAVPYADVTLTIGNGPYAGETEAYSSRQYNASSATGRISQQTMFYTLFTGDHVAFAITGMDLDAKTYPVSGKLNGVSGYETNMLNVSMTGNTANWTINPRPLTITTSSASKVFDGEPLTGSVTVTGLAAKDADKMIVTAAAITNVGTAENTYTIDWGGVNPDNYTITKNIGTLEVTANTTPITFKASSAEKVYDGSELTSSVVTAEGLPSGFTFEAAASGAQTDAGTSDNVVTSYKIFKDETDVTANFSGITTEKGTLKVTPAPATVTTGSASKKYDGTALKKAEASITGLVSGETATVTATGSQTNVGESDNTYTIAWGTAKAENYSLTDSLGKLQVTENDTAVTFTADSASKPYDGTPLTANKVTASGLPTGLSFTATASGSQTNAGTSENTVFSYVILDGTNADVTANFTNRTTVPGELTVTPRKVSFDLNGTSRKYNSLPLFPSKVTGEDEDGSDLIPTSENSIGDYYLGLPYKLESVFSLVGSDEITMTSGPELENGCTDVGSYTIIPKIVFNYGVAANYDFSYINNIFSITPMNIRVDVLAGEPVEYDGAFHNGDVKVYIEDVELTDRSYYDASKIWSYNSDELNISVEVQGGRTDAGESDLTCTCKFSTYYNLDASANTNLTVNDGVKLTVLPKPVTVSTGSAEKVYDGTALTAPGTLTGLVASDESKVTWNVTGTITDADTSSNTYTIDWGDVNKNNYAITENLGTLKVKPAPIKVSTKDISESKTYDGKPSPVNTDRPTISGWHEAGIEAVSQQNQITDVGEVPLKYEMKWGSAKESNYEITEELGTLSITPLPVEFDLNCSDKDFDGYPALPGSIDGTYKGGDAVEKESEEFALDSYGWQVSLTAEFNLIGGGKVRLYTEGQVNAGSYTLTPTETMLSGNAGNYAFSYTNNTGTVYPLKVNFSLGGTDDDESGLITYDGLFHGGDLSVYCDTEGFFDVDQLSDTLWKLSAHNGDVVSVTITGGGTEPGSYPLTCSYSFDAGSEGNYLISVTEKTMKVITDNTSIIFKAPSAEKVYDGSALTASEVTVEGLPAGFTYEATVSGTQTNVGTSNNVVSSYKILKDGVDVTANFTGITTSKGTLTITPAQLTITTPTLRKAYNAAPLMGGEATVTGLASGETITVTTASITDPGTVPNTYTIEWGETDPANYTLKEKLGTLEVEKRKFLVTVYAETGNVDMQTVPYIGEWYTCECSRTFLNEDKTGFSTSYKMSSNWCKYTMTASWGDEFVLDCTGGGFNVGEYPSACSVTFNSGNPANYEFEIVCKTLTITPATLTITTAGAEKKYDGVPLTNSDVTITGLKRSETVTVTATGSQTEVGTSDNTYELTWGTAWNSAKESNYIIDDTLGTLKVTKNDTLITLTAASDSKVYDGTALTNSTVTATGLPEGFTVEATASGSQTDAGYSANVVNDGYIIKNALGEDKTANFTNIVLKNGTLTVEQLQLEIDLGGKTRQYDGTYGSLNPKLKYVNGDETHKGTTLSGTVTEFPGWYKAEFSLFTGKALRLTVSGYTSKDAGTYTLSGTCEFTDNGSNYSVSYTNNEVIITPAPITLDSTKYSESKIYDGLPLPTNTGRPVDISYGDPANTSVEGELYGTDRIYAERGFEYITEADQSADVDIEYSWGDGTNSENYNVNKVKGSLTIKKRELIIRSANAEKPYDGEPLTNHEYSIEGDGLAPDETITVNFTGSQTEVGSSDNTFTVTWGSAKEKNYNLVPIYGTLTVTAAEESNSGRMFTFGKVDRRTEEVNETDPPNEKTGETEGQVEPDQPDSSDDPPDETGNQTAADSSDPPDSGFVDEVSADVPELDPQIVEPADTGEASELDNAEESQSGEAADTEEETEPDPQIVEPADTGDASGLDTAAEPQTGEAADNGEETEPDPQIVGPADTGEASELDNAEESQSGEAADTEEETEPDLQIVEPADTGEASEPDAAEPQPIEAADTKEETEPDSAADSSQTEPADSGSKLSSGFTFAAAASGSRTETGSSDDAANDGDETEDATIAEVPAETADEPPMAEQLKLRIDLGGKTMKYDGTRGSVLKPKLTYMSGDYAGQTIDPEKISSVSGGCEAIFKLFTGDTLKLTVSGFASCDAGDYPLHGSCKFKGGAAEYKVVDYINDTVTVTPSQLTVASLSAEKDYDGETLVMHESYIDGLAYGETITVNYTGSQTEPGSSENTFTVSWGTARETNYVLNPIYGTLTVSDPVMSGVPKPADATPEPTPTPPGEGEGGEPEPTVTPPGEGEGGESEPTSAPSGEGEDGGSEPEPAADPPGNGDEGEEAGPPANDPPGNGDKGEEAGPPADDAPESAGNDEKTEPALPADKPENNGGEKETPASDPFAAEPEERNSEPAQVPETSAVEPADIGGSSAPAPVPDVPKTEPAVPDPGD